MAGIFDAFSNMTPEQNQGLLAFASSLLQSGGLSRTPINSGQALGGGLQAFQQGVQGAQDRAYQQQLRSLQLEEANMTAEERKRKRQLEQAIQEAAQQSVQTPAQMALAAGGGPTQANADAMQGMQPSFDEQAFINRVQAIDPLRAQEFARQFAKSAPEFDTKINYLNGPDGKPVAVLVNKAGQVKTLEGMTPREKAEFLNLGGREVAVNPFDVRPGQSFQRTMTPGESASNAVARANLGLAAQRLDLDRQKTTAAAGKLDKEQVQRKQDANDVLSILNEAEDLLPKSTSSYLGTGYDLAARAFGNAPAGAQVAAQLKVLQGALISKMPKMSGPQSDKDVQLYREMAGQIGDSTLPVETRQAAADVLRSLNEKYLGMSRGSSRQQKSGGGWSIQRVGE